MTASWLRASRSSEHSLVGHKTNCFLCVGNHAQALAYHGSQVGVPVTVVMPIVAPIMKVHINRVVDR